MAATAYRLRLEETRCLLLPIWQRLFNASRFAHAGKRRSCVTLLARHSAVTGSARPCLYLTGKGRSATAWEAPALMPEAPVSAVVRQAWEAKSNCDRQQERLVHKWIHIGRRSHPTTTDSQLSSGCQSPDHTVRKSRNVSQRGKRFCIRCTESASGCGRALTTRPVYGECYTPTKTLFDLR